LGKDATAAKGDDRTVVGVVREEVERLRQIIRDLRDKLFQATLLAWDQPFTEDQLNMPTESEAKADWIAERRRQWDHETRALIEPEKMD
jgi:hypothetical protein